jgi:putative DNA primase/helicase
MAWKEQRRLAKREAAQTRARATARDIVYDADPSERSHPYLERKMVRPHSTFVSARGDLIIPMRNGEGTLHSLQFISPDGSKRYLKDGRVKGCMFEIGRTENAEYIGIGEGFATSATVFQSTTIPLAVAFDAGNLLAVALAMRARHPRAGLILFSDDDWLTPGNPGLTKAREAAEAAGGVVVAPDFGNERERGAKHTDWNDLQLYYGGRPEVQRQIMTALDG